jgi:hypothetical protein
MFIGLLLAQGLYYVLRHLLIAGLLMTREEAAGDVWAALSGLILVQGLQAVSVLCGGVLVGAGERRGFVLGAMVGVWNGVLFVMAHQLFGRPVTPITVLGEPMLQAAFGAIGGLIGGSIWKPLPVPTLPAEFRPQASLPPVRRQPSSFEGPVAWGRVITGVALAVGGVVWTDVIRDFVLDASEGTLRIDTHLQAQLVTWEISALVMLVGSALAGATTRNGLKQGLAFGIGTGVVLAGIRLASMGLSLQLLIFSSASTVCLGLAGGWFGSQLLPPVYAHARRVRRGPGLLAPN